VAIWNRPFEVFQNEDTPFVLGFASADPSGLLSLAVPYSFTGTTVKFTARYTSSPTSTLLVQLTSGGGGITFGSATIGGASVGTVNFTIPNAVTVTMPVGQFYCDLLWINGSQQTYLAQGPFIVNATAGR